MDLLDFSLMHFDQFLQETHEWPNPSLLLGNKVEEDSISDLGGLGVT
jgi:hypothetical protein